MKCKYCDSKNLDMLPSGPHQKLVCGDCLKFQKFLSKGHCETFKQLQKKIKEE